jgi:hypothetical protein
MVGALPLPLLPLLLLQRWPLNVMLTGWLVPQPGTGWNSSKVCIASPVKLWLMQPCSSAGTSVSAACRRAGNTHQSRSKLSKKKTENQEG